MHYRVQFEREFQWSVLRDNESIGLVFDDEAQAFAVTAALNEAVEFGMAKSKDAIRETAELFFSRA